MYYITQINDKFNCINKKKVDNYVFTVIILKLISFGGYGKYEQNVKAACTAVAFSNNSKVLKRLTKKLGL